MPLIPVMCACCRPRQCLSVLGLVVVVVHCVCVVRSARRLGWHEAFVGAAGLRRLVVVLVVYVDLVYEILIRSLKAWGVWMASLGHHQHCHSMPTMHQSHLLLA